MQRHSLAVVAAMVPLALMTACSSAAPSTIDTSPMVEAEGTRVAPTVQAAVTQVVPTLQAAATAIAPTAQALAPTVQAAAATVVANAPVTIVDARVAPNDATITIQPTGDTSADLSNWTLNVGGTSARLPTNTMVRPGEALTLHTATGTSSGRDVYLGEAAQALTQAVRPGARVALMDPSGSTVSSFTIPAA